MFQTIIDLYDVFRTDVDIGEEFEGDDTALDTDPAHYLSHDGFYLRQITKFRRTAMGILNPSFQAIIQG